MLEKNEIEIIDIVKTLQESSSKEIFEKFPQSKSYATIKRILTKLVADKLLITVGQGKSTKYRISAAYEILQPVDIEEYYKKEIDERTIKGNFNFQLMETLNNLHVFTDIELNKLTTLQQKYQENVNQLSETEYNKELERLAIDLSWKSSQIEGNTYSLLETEQLLKDKKTAAGKTKEEAVMLLNHKAAIDFIIEHPDYLQPLSVPKIEDIHNILTKELAIERNIRTRRIGISGTNYKPLDNEFQLKEAMNDMCILVNAKSTIFEKALLLLVLSSYIQPFMDGNKRTARIISSSVLVCNHYCPISYRTVDSVEYKKAMLLFYEQNNISAFKEIFTQQFEFAVNTYF